MTISSRDLEKRLAQLRREVLKRDAERHLSILNSISELPIDLRTPALAGFAARDPIHTIILFPPHIQRGWHYIPRQVLLFNSKDLLHLRDSIWPNQEPQLTHLAGRDILYMRVTLLLLYGYLEIVAAGSQSPIRLGMEFNTVAWFRMSPPLRQLLSGAASLGARPVVPEGSDISPSAQQAYSSLPLKFSNGVRIYGLLPGERLQNLVFQPGTFKPWLLLLRRAVTSDTLVLLTDNYLAVIREELNVGQGWIVSHLPRGCIAGIQVKPIGMRWCELTIQLDRGGQVTEFTLLLERSAAEAVRDLWRSPGRA